MGENPDLGFYRLDALLPCNQQSTKELKDNEDDNKQPNKQYFYTRTN